MKGRIKDLTVGAMVVAVLILLGFTRDFIFENINFQLYKLWYGSEEFTLPPSLMFLETWEADTLYYLKFPLTIFTILLFYGVAHFTVRYYFREKRMLLLNFGAHLLFCFIGGLFFLLGMIFDQYNQGYHFSRIFLEFVQSPLMLMIILPACKLIEKKEK